MNRKRGADEPVTELDPRFSSPDATPPAWTDVVAAMQAAEIFWLSTVRRDGRPHVTPLPAMWLDGALHFCTGQGEQKANNLEHDEHCILTTGTDRFRSGMDVVVEGRAERVTDLSLLEPLAAMWREKLDWQFEAVEGGFRDASDPSDASDPADGGGERRIAMVFAVRPDKVLAFSKGEPFSQTRYRFTRTGP
ncbi:MAG TPA: pyridoxamine 5'-phosphate oxidase family protein [Acidimicrobiales bacterium]|jgi:general stress protein 26|nr:pyridoxamine 5'-phosphate oxidase family protein [Acidimicrobiales bacterium]